MIRLVYGPPGAGKTEYVTTQQKPGDLVIDLDQIRASGVSEDTAKNLRNLMEAGAKSHQDGDVWIVRTLADTTERAEFMDRVGVEDAHVLDVDAETAKKRVRDRDGSDEKFPAIDRWWAEYQPDKGTSTEEDPVADQEQQTDQNDTQSEAQQDTQRGPNGYPEDTPLAEMTTEEALAYWKHNSRRHERTAKDLRLQLEKTQEPKTTEPEGLDPVEVARQEARREVFEARLDAAAAKFPDADFSELRKHLDLASFTGEDGRIDPERVDALFKSLPTGKPEVHDPKGWGSNHPFESSSGLERGRQLWLATHPKN